MVSVQSDDAPPRAKAAKRNIERATLERCGIIFDDGTTASSVSYAPSLPTYVADLRDFLLDFTSSNHSKSYGPDYNKEFKELQKRHPKFRSYLHQRATPDIWSLLPPNGVWKITDTSQEATEVSPELSHVRGIALDSISLARSHEAEWVEFYVTNLFPRYEATRNRRSAMELLFEQWHPHREVHWTDRGMWDSRELAARVLTFPKPDFTYGFPIYTSEQAACLPRGLVNDDCVKNFSVENLCMLRGRIPAKGLTTAPTKGLLRKAQDANASLADNDLICLPWAVIEVKRAGRPKKEEQRCYCQAANATATAIKMRELLFDQAYGRCPDDVPPVIAMTCIGPEVKLWLTYRDPTPERPSQIRMVCVWASHMDLTWGVYATKLVVMNMKAWANKVLRPKLSACLTQIRASLPQLYRLKSQLNHLDEKHAQETQLNNHVDTPPSRRDSHTLSDNGTPTGRRHLPSLRETALGELDGSVLVELHSFQTLIDGLNLWQLSNLCEQVLHSTKGLDIVETIFHALPTELNVEWLRDGFLRGAQSLEEVIASLHHLPKLEELRHICKAFLGTLNAPLCFEVMRSAGLASDTRTWGRMGQEALETIQNRREEKLAQSNRGRGTAARRGRQGQPQSESKILFHEEDEDEAGEIGFIVDGEESDQSPNASEVDQALNAASEDTASGCGVGQSDNERGRFQDSSVGDKRHPTRRSEASVLGSKDQLKPPQQDFDNVSEGHRSRSVGALKDNPLARRSKPCTMGVDDQTFPDWNSDDQEKEREDQAASFWLTEDELNIFRANCKSHGGHSENTTPQKTRAGCVKAAVHIAETLKVSIEKQSGDGRSAEQLPVQAKSRPAEKDGHSTRADTNRPQDTSDSQAELPSTPRRSLSRERSTTGRQRNGRPSPVRAAYTAPSHLGRNAERLRVRSTSHKPPQLTLRQPNFVGSNSREQSDHSLYDSEEDKVRASPPVSRRQHGKAVSASGISVRRPKKEAEL